MISSTSGKIRFAKVVEAVGRPEVVALWTKAERDKTFKRAVWKNRPETNVIKTPAT